MKFFFIALIISFNYSLFADARQSYSNTLQLDLSNHTSAKGVDIWMTRDKGATWVLIGKTFGPEKSYTYRSRKEGSHGFHYHMRRGQKDSFRPHQNSSIHESIELGMLEESNKNILYSNRRRLSIEYSVSDAGKRVPLNHGCIIPSIVVAIGNIMVRMMTIRVRLGFRRIVMGFLDLKSFQLT